MAPEISRNHCEMEKMVESEASAAACQVSLWRDPSLGDAGALVRCGLRASLPSGGMKRRKVLTVVLDRSGSMAGAMWRRVVDAVVGVVTDELLEDPLVSVTLVVYSDSAREVRLPGSAAELRELLLSREFAPMGGTCFRAAFESALQVVKREVASHEDAGAKAKDVDVATLIFTDGEDTSVKGRAGRGGVRLVDKEASSLAARNAGDAFRKGLQATGCSTYICVAAFGADHDPRQCQYLSDRYYYINRSEVLSEVLSGGLGALLSSAGQCSIRVQLPTGLELEEQLPESLTLDAQGRLDHHIWLRGASAVFTSGGSVMVELAGAAVGDTALHGTAGLDSLHSVGSNSFEAHLFLVDHVAMQLRQVAHELCGQRPSAEELAALRERLTCAKDRLQPTAEAANAVTGQLRGRAALRERLAEVQALRERLSYALGHFDEHDQDVRKIGIVAIDAILRDAGQHVPQGPASAEHVRRADALAALPLPEILSHFGREFSTDAYSCCDAHELASQGDALFFQLGSVRFGSDGELVSAEDGSGFIAHEAFTVLSQGGRQAVKCVGSEEGFTHLGLPLYVMPGHFLRAHLLLPNVLQRLSPSGKYEPGKSERILLTLLGRSLSVPAKTEAHIMALLHKARAVHAVLSTSPAPGGNGSLLDAVTAEAKGFLEDAPGVRASVASSDLHAVAAAGMLADIWTPTQITRLGEALVAECLRRRIARALRNAGDAQKLCLAWALLGSVDEDDAWLDREVDSSASRELNLRDAGFSLFTASDELEALELKSPGQSAPRAAGAAALMSIISSGGQADGLPRASDWGILRQQMTAWARTVNTAGGLGVLWQRLDGLMIEGTAEHLEALNGAVAMLRTSPHRQGIRDAFADTSAIAAIATAACMPNAKPERSIRHTVAGALRQLVEKRKALVRAYPIVGADFPQLDAHTRERVGEIWGAQAEPVDAALHHKAKLRVSRRMMKTRVSMSIREALTDKEYRKRGGKFAFPSPLDTFVRGLHRRTADLHDDWRVRLGLDTSGDEMRSNAVAEMLLRLRWDDSDNKARAKLSAIVARIWDALEGMDVSGRPPLSSALWLDDDDSSLENSKAAPCTACDDPLSCSSTALGPASDPCSMSVHQDHARLPGDSEGVKITDVVMCEGNTPSKRVLPLSASGKDGEAPAEEEASAVEDNGPEIVPVAVSSVPPADPIRAPPGLDHQDHRHAPSPEAAMDEGLRTAFAGLSADLRENMERFAEDKQVGSRLKLPPTVRPKQRKAVHLWAEAHGLEHRSFGWSNRRRLHLAVPGTRPGAAPAEHGDRPADGEEAFDWAAWQSEEDGDQESDVENEEGW